MSYKAKDIENNLRKKIIRLGIIIFYIIYMVLCCASIINILTDRSSRGEYINIIIFTIFTIFIYNYFITKRIRDSMYVMKRFCTYTDLMKRLENEDFRRIEAFYDEVYESKKWLCVHGIFVPKNFIVYAYVTVGPHKSKSIWINLINGRGIPVEAGIKDENRIMTIGLLKRYVPQLKVNNRINALKISKELQKKYLQVKEDKVSLDDLINNWTGYFEIENTNNN